jgi:hypothetical protein
MEWVKFSDRRPTNEECNCHGAYILALDRENPHRPRILGWYYGTDYPMPANYKESLRIEIESKYDYWCPMPELPAALRSSDEH